MRKLTAVDAVGILNDETLGGLAKDLGQPGDRDAAGANQILQYLTWSDRGKLVDITDEDSVADLLPPSPIDL